MRVADQLTREGWPVEVKHLHIDRPVVDRPAA
jgi:hypothetical protein